MAKLTFDTEVFLKHNHAKAIIKAVINNGKAISYLLDNGQTVSADEIITELPVKKTKASKDKKDSEITE